jgi:molybdate transport system substrate-binding protein
MPNLHVLTSNSTKPVIEALITQFAQETQQTVTIAADSAKNMLDRISNGEAGDVVVLGSGIINELANQKVILNHPMHFATAFIGIGIKKGAPLPDITTEAALRQTLLNSRSIAHTLYGASGQYIPTLLKRLGITEDMKHKTVTRPGGYIGSVVVTGEAELALQQLPELLAVPDLEVIGLIPDSLQKPLLTSAGVLSRSEKVTEALAFISYMSHPQHATSFQKNGLLQAKSLIQ